MWRQITETRMWPLLVVRDSPLFDLSARVRQRYEHMLVQAFLAKAAVIRLDERILNRLDGFDSLKEQPMLVHPLVQVPRAKLAAIVGLNHRRQSTRFAQLAEHHRHSFTREREVHLQCRALAAPLIDDGQHPETPAVSQRVVDDLWFSPSGGSLTTRAWLRFLRRRRRRSDSPSSRYSRSTRL